MVEKWHGRVEMPSILPSMHQICLNFQLEVLFTIFDHSGIAQIEYWGLQFTLDNRHKIFNGFSFIESLLVWQP